MRSASEFRQMARETLRGNWKLAMGTGLAASLIGAEIADTAPNGITELQKVIQARPEVKNVLTQVFLMRSMLLPLVLLLIWGLMVVIIGGAGQMGYARFHLNLAEKKEASFSDLFSQFSRITDGVAMVFVRGFYIFCWPCLFFVPGFIKTYSYAMTPYVLMEHPEYSANEAITESRRLMDGKKWNLFCLGHFFGVGVNMLHAGFLPISVPIQASHHNTGYFSKKKKTCIPTNYRRICKSYGGDDQI